MSFFRANSGGEYASPAEVKACDRKGGDTIQSLEEARHNSVIQLMGGLSVDDCISDLQNITDEKIGDCSQMKGEQQISGYQAFARRYYSDEVQSSTLQQSIQSILSLANPSNEQQRRVYFGLNHLWAAGQREVLEKLFCAGEPSSFKDTVSAQLEEMSKAGSFLSLASDAIEEIVGFLGIWDRARMLGVSRQFRRDVISATPNNYVLKNIRLIAGDRCVFALYGGCKTFSLGNGQLYQLGHGGCADKTMPSAIVALTDKQIKNIYIRYSHCFFALGADGKVYSWGEPIDRDFNLPGHEHSLGSAVPKVIRALEKEEVVQLAASRLTLGIFALCENGRVYSWGAGFFGYLGHGNTENKDLPTLIRRLENEEVIQLAVGGFYKIFALCRSGRVYSWGHGEFGQLGHGDNNNRAEPTIITALESKGVIKLVTGYDHTFARCRNGDIYSWGRGEQGQLGQGDFDNKTEPTLISVLVGKDVCQLVPGVGCAFALCSNGEVYSWGKGTFGQLGHGDNNHRAEPTLIAALAGRHLIGLIVSGDHRIYMWCKDGSVFSWGDGALGQLGHGDFKDKTEPTLIRALAGKGVIQIFNGHGCVFALCSTGEIYSWGSGKSGQLGLGDCDDRNVPTLINNLPSFANEPLSETVQRYKEAKLEEVEDRQRCIGLSSGRR